jgi:hypothetical protein
MMRLAQVVHWRLQLAGSAVAALLVAAAGVATAGDSVPAGDSVQGAAPAVQRGDDPRPFEHARHEAVPCTACHGGGAEHRTITVRSPRGCASCHHAEASAHTCTACHSSPSLPEPGAVSRVLDLTVWNASRVRQLPFGHVVHAAVACRSCHATPVMLAMERGCGSCHESHHQPEASCAACHDAPLPGTHGARVHLTCAGAGCHASRVAPPPALSRELCLVCHGAQQQHEPGLECAHCHLPTAGAP